MMTYYRYELPDGGGPFFTKDGKLRANTSFLSHDNTLSVCDSIETLKKWFSERKIPTEDFCIAAYRGVVVRKLRSGEILIAKDSAVKVL